MDLSVKRGSRFESRKNSSFKEAGCAAAARLSAGLAFSQGGHNSVEAVKRLET
jgi:hypothetical protein